jgi:hypothetical protein
MRVTLIHCDYDIPEMLKDLAMPGMPLGLGYVAAVAERDGHKVTVIDAYAEGLNREKAINRILASQPDLLGLSCVTASVYYAMDIVKAVRDRIPKIVFGGIHATFVPATFMDDADVVFRGESEESFPEYLSGKSLKDIGGISYIDWTRCPCPLATSSTSTALATSYSGICRSPACWAGAVAPCAASTARTRRYTTRTGVARLS